MADDKEIKLKKTTKIRFCQLPKGASSTKLTRKSGQMLKDTEILDIYEDIVNNPYLPRIMSLLGLLNKAYVKSYAKDPDGGPILVTKEVYVVSRKQYTSIDIDEIYSILRHESKSIERDEMNEIIITLMGIQYILHSKRQFEIDVVIIEGNTLEDLEEAKRRSKATGI